MKHRYDCMLCVRLCACREYPDANYYPQYPQEVNYVLRRGDSNRRSW